MTSGDFLNFSQAGGYIVTAIAGIAVWWQSWMARKETAQSSRDNACHNSDTNTKLAEVHEAAKEIKTLVNGGSEKLANAAIAATKAVTDLPVLASQAASQAASLIIEAAKNAAALVKSAADEAAEKLRKPPDFTQCTNFGTPHKCTSCKKRKQK